MKPGLAIPNSEIGPGYTGNKLKVEKHVRTCGKGNFPIFPFLQLRSYDADLCREFEDYFIKKYETELNSL